eukprot:UN10875
MILQVHRKKYKFEDHFDHFDAFAQFQDIFENINQAFGELHQSLDELFKIQEQRRQGNFNKINYLKNSFVRTEVQIHSHQILTAGTVVQILTVGTEVQIHSLQVPFQVGHPLPLVPPPQVLLTETHKAI